MIQEILTAAAVPSQEARFPDPPELHAVFFDSTTTGDGEDTGPALSIIHDYTVELYTPSVAVGNDAKRRICEQLDARGIRYTAQGWYWLNDIRRYQEIIEFTYIEKIGGISNV